MTGCYLIHFNQPFKHARHYLGFAKDIDARLSHHAAGNGSNLIRVIQDAGITWQLVRTWPNATRSTERRLKDQHNSARLCPICQQEVTRDHCHC